MTVDGSSDDDSAELSAESEPDFESADADYLPAVLVSGLVMRHGDASSCAPHSVNLCCVPEHVILRQRRWPQRPTVAPRQRCPRRLPLQ